MVNRRLAHVVAVAQSGSFTKAAKKVAISQSGITKSIADMERELGFTLFYRTAKGALPTEEGREFIDQATRLLDDAAALMMGNRESRDPFNQALRIGVCPASIEWLLTNALGSLITRHPNLRFEVVSASFERMVQLVRAGGVDVAVGFDDAFAEWGDLSRQTVGYMRAVLFVRKDHPLVRDHDGDPAKLTDFKIVMPADSRPYGPVIQALFQDAGIFLWRRRIHTIDHFPTVLRLVRVSDAVGVTTEEFAQSPGFAAEFERVPGESILAPALLCCATRSRWEPSPAVRAFLRAIQEHLPLQA